MTVNYSVQIGMYGFIYGPRIGSNILKLVGENSTQQFDTGWVETIGLAYFGRKEQVVWFGLGGIASGWSWFRF